MADKARRRSPHPKPLDSRELNQAAEIAMNSALLLARFGLLESSNFELVEVDATAASAELPDIADLDFYLFRDRLMECGLKTNLESLLDHVDKEIHAKTSTVLRAIFPDKVKLIFDWMNRFDRAFFFQFSYCPTDFE
jgi:hypothetical protein